MNHPATELDGDARTLIELKDMDDPRTIAEMKAADENWVEGRVRSVKPYEDGSYWTVEWEETAAPGGELIEGSVMGFGVPRVDGKPEPKVGDMIRTYGRFGRPVYGVDLNGVEVYWETPWERFAKRIVMLAGFDRDRRERFVEQKAELDAKYEGLPAPLKARIDRFRAERADFRVDGESYEMAAVADAPKIARAIAGDQGWKLDDNCYAVSVPKDQIEVAVRAFVELSYEEQQKLVPDLEPGHSGNTFAGAVRLAWGLLNGEDL